MLLFARRGKTCVCLNPALARPKGDIVKGVFGVGVPASIQNLLNVTGMTVLNNFTAAFGPDAIAAMGIAYKISMIPMYIAMGVSQGNVQQTAAHGAHAGVEGGPLRPHQIGHQLAGDGAV